MAHRLHRESRIAVHEDFARRELNLTLVVVPGAGLDSNFFK